MIKLAQIPGILALSILLSQAGADAPATYLQGGNKPFPPELKSKLDAHAAIISLGVNSEWLEASHIDAAKYIDAIDLIATAVEKDQIPGAVFYADRLVSNTIPVAIGYMMTDPQKRRAVGDTNYDIGDLTGPLITNPLALIVVMQGKLKMSDKLSDLFPVFAESDKAGITVGQLLHQSSGLPAVYAEPTGMKTRDDILEFIKNLPPATPVGSEVEFSPLNEVLLGLILEKIHGKPYAEIVSETVLTTYEMKPSGLGAFPDHRQILAPGEYSKLLGRMAWGEPNDRIGLVLGPDCGHSGFVTYCDALANMLKSNIPLISLSTIPGGEDFTPMGHFFKPAIDLKGGAQMAAGFRVGRFGPRSYGWDAQSGCSVWVLPDKMAYIIFLSNYSHPNGLAARTTDVRDHVLPLLADSLLVVSPPVDTHKAGTEPAPVTPSPSP